MPDRRRVTLQQVVALLGVFLTALSIGAALVSGLQRWRSHANAEDALCNRVAQLEKIIVEYYPAESNSIYYPGSRSCP